MPLGGRPYPTSMLWDLGKLTPNMEDGFGEVGLWCIFPSLLDSLAMAPRTGVCIDPGKGTDTSGLSCSLIRLRVERLIGLIQSGQSVSGEHYNDIYSNEPHLIHLVGGCLSSSLRTMDSGFCLNTFQGLRMGLPMQSPGVMCISF